MTPILEPEGLPPGFLERIDPEGRTIPELVALIIAERGSPMAIEEIADRMAELGVVRTVPSLRKSWHGLRELRKTRDGKLTIVPSREEWSRWEHLVGEVRRELETIGLPAAGAASTSDRGLPATVDDTAPVTIEEVLTGLENDLPASVSLMRKLALLTEASGCVLEIPRAIELLARCKLGVTEEAVRHSSSCGGPVRRDGEGRLVSVADHESLRIARRILRERLAEIERSKAQEREREKWQAERREERRREDEEVRRRYGEAAKLAIRCFFTRGKKFAAASLLDPDSRLFQDCADAAEIVARIERSKFIFGLDPWGDLQRLGLEQGDRTLVDLSPPVKTVQLSKQRRTLRVSPELIIAGTLGISRGIGSPKKLNEYVATGNWARLFARLRSDLKALWRLYEYGCLHGRVVLRWGFLGRIEGVDWNVGRLPRLREIFEAAARSREELEIVLGSAPGWEDPWARGQRIRVVGVSFDRYEVEFPESGARMLLNGEEIAAVRPRPVGEEPPFSWPDEKDRVS